MRSAGRKVVGSLAEESLVESEQAMRAAYHVQRPELPQASGDVSAGSNPSDVKQALDSDAAALMATGVNCIYLVTAGFCSRLV